MLVPNKMRLSLQNSWTLVENLLFNVLLLLDVDDTFTLYMWMCVRVREHPGLSWDKRQLKKPLEESGEVDWQQACMQECYRALQSVIYMCST